MNRKLLFALSTLIFLGAGCHRDAKEVALIDAPSEDTTVQYSIVLPKEKPMGFSSYRRVELGQYATSDFKTIPTGNEGPCEEERYVSGGEITIYDRNTGHGGEGTDPATDNALPTCLGEQIGGNNTERHGFADFCARWQRAEDVHFCVGEQVYTVSLRAAEKDFDKLFPAFNDFINTISFKKD